MPSDTTDPRDGVPADTDPTTADPDAPNPDALIEGNRVATAEDME